MAAHRWARWAVLVALTPTVLRAELLYFVQGGSVQAPAVATPEGQVRIELPDGPIAFARREFRKVVPGHWPEAEWPKRREAALAAGPDARFAAAWWALQNGLTPQAEQLIRVASAADPGHAANTRLKGMLDRLENRITETQRHGEGGRLGGSAAEPDLGSIGRSLASTFAMVSGPNVLLLHQHSADEAAERLEYLERVVRTYYLFFAAYGLELPLPGRRLVTAWFADRDDYLAFLHAEGADAFRNTLGYYHPTQNVVVTYDTRGRGRDQGGRLPDVPSRDEGRRRLLAELDRRSKELGTAAHEMVHLLVAESGLAPRHDDFPLWLHEGLAAQFEVVRGGRWAGFGHAHDLRLPDWRSIEPRPRLVPLLRDTGFGQGYRRDAYASAWALVYYLRRERPAQFVTFLDLLRTPDPEVRSRGDRVVALFRAAFGDDLIALEADWHRTMSALRTPLEEGM